MRYLFQSTFPRRERLSSVQTLSNWLQFQSTFPRRERRAISGYTSCAACFNPRSRVGNDIHERIRSDIPFGFNPRSRVGNDFFHIIYNNFFCCFNPRSRVGNDSCAAGLQCWGSCFNPRSRVGNDSAFFEKIAFFKKFQSTFPRRERQKCHLFTTQSLEFQSTFPRRERRPGSYHGLIFS